MTDKSQAAASAPTPTATGAAASRRPPVPNRKGQDPLWVRLTLTSLALLVMTVLVVIPVASVFYEALAPGLRTYWENLTADPDTRHAVLLTLIVAPIAVACNVVF